MNYLLSEKKDSRLTPINNFIEREKIFMMISFEEKWEQITLQKSR